MLCISFYILALRFTGYEPGCCLSRLVSSLSLMLQIVPVTIVFVTMYCGLCGTILLFHWIILTSYKLQIIKLLGTRRRKIFSRQLLYFRHRENFPKYQSPKNVFVVSLKIIQYNYFYRFW